MKTESRARLLENAAQLARDRKKEKEVKQGVDQVERKVAPILGAMPGIENGIPKS
jgi:Flp pilus assembly protein TadB